jgi:hypothetical protein
MSSGEHESHLLFSTLCVNLFSLSSFYLFIYLFILSMKITITVPSFQFQTQIHLLYVTHIEPFEVKLLGV